MEILTHSAEETRALGARLGALVQPGWIVGLDGDLGAGKTTLVQGLVTGAGGAGEEVTSPTFTLLHQYAARLPVYHFDLYRLERPGEVEAIGFDERVYGEGVAVIEWLGKFPTLQPDRWLSVKIFTLDETTRRFEINGVGSGWDALLSAIANESTTT